MPVSTHNFEIVAGQTWTVQFQYKLRKSRAPVDLSGYAVRMQVRRFDNKLLFDSTPENVRVLDAGEGIILVEVPAAATRAFLEHPGNKTTVRYAIELYTESDHVEPFLAGNVTVHPNAVQVS